MNITAAQHHRSGGFSGRALLFSLLLLAVAAGAWAQDTGWVITTDYSTFGRVRSVALTEPWGVSADLATIPGDAVGRYHDGLVYIVGRGDANTIGIYDPAAGFTLVREFSIGAGRNPQDIAFAPDGTAFVSCYDSAELLAVDADAGQVLASYSTAAFADADGLPETGWMAAVGDRLYITAQLLDRANWYAPTGPGSLLVFDMATREWVDQDPGQADIQPISLLGSDPYTDLQVFAVGGVLHARVGCVGYFGVSDGGIEEIDLENGVSLGYVATEADLGGDVTRFVQRDDVLYVLVSDASFITSVRSWDLDTSTLTVLDTGNGYVHADLAVTAAGRLLVADRTVGAAGVRVFDTATGAELTAGATDTGLPPFMFVMPVSGAISPVPTVPAAALAMAAPYPNPGNPRTRIVLQTTPGARITVTLADLRGRAVHSVTVTADGAGRAACDLDGVDDAGRPLASGVYQVMAVQGGQRAVRRWTLVR